MTRERAAELLSGVTVLDDPEMEEANKMAISALRQQEHFRDLTKKVEPLTKTPDIWRMLFFIALGVILRLIWDRRC